MTGVTAVADLVRHILRAGDEHGVRFVKAAAACTDEIARGPVAELAVEPLLFNEEPDVQYAMTVLSRLQEMAVTRQIVEPKSRLQRVNPVEAPDRHTKLFGELIASEQYRIALREKGIQGL